MNPTSYICELNLSNKRKVDSIEPEYCGGFFLDNEISPVIHYFIFFIKRWLVNNMLIIILYIIKFKCVNLYAFFQGIHVMLCAHVYAIGANIGQINEHFVITCLLDYVE